MYHISVPLLASLFFSVGATWFTLKLIPLFGPMFIQNHLSGRDLSKKDKPEIPEAMGVIAGAVYLVAMFLFIPFPFVDYFIGGSEFRHHKFSEFLCALLSICCMIFLGFADDVLNLKWRDKLVLPTVATLPLLMVYMVNIGSTTIVVPQPLNALLGDYVNLGPLYYLYMGMLAVFCTNAINILAGVNGLESGQSLVIGVSIAINNLIQVLFFTCCVDNHLLSLYLILPFIGVNAALFYYNRYPSKVFVGDTFCYFAGMTFAVVGILGHFSKTMLLFFVPQIFNFVYSVPQLFHIIPCPRHRMPSFDPTTERVGMSTCKFKVSSLSPLGRTIYKILTTLHLVTVKRIEPTTAAKFITLGTTEPEVEMNNLTIINFILRLTGPMNEGKLTMILLTLQTLCSVMAFGLRYFAARLVYQNIV